MFIMSTVVSSEPQPFYGSGVYPVCKVNRKICLPTYPEFNGKANNVCKYWNRYQFSYLRLDRYQNSSEESTFYGKSINIYIATMKGPYYFLFFSVTYHLSKHLCKLNTNRKFIRVFIICHSLGDVTVPGLTAE